MERTEGHHKTQDYKIKFIDLPGTYSLTSYSMEEIVARDVIINEKPDVVVCMLDAVALERSLYLVVQLLEIGAPVVVGLNMMDEAKKKGIRIDSRVLSKLLQVPVVECIARKGVGKKELIDSIIDLVENKNKGVLDFHMAYGSDLDPALVEMVELIEENNFMAKKYPSRWLAVKYMEEDDNILRLGEKAHGETHDRLLAIVQRVETHTEKPYILIQRQ